MHRERDMMLPGPSLSESMKRDESSFYAFPVTLGRTSCRRYDLLRRRELGK
jgi:hypothetical protein